MHLHRTILKLRSLAEIIHNFDRDVYWRNNGSIVNLNIILCVSNKWILYKVTCGGRARASPEWTVSTAPSVCVLRWVKYREHLTLLVILCIIVYDKKKKKNIGYSFFQNRYPIMVKCLNIGKNIGKPMYRSISSNKPSPAFMGAAAICICQRIFCSVV